jgi:hypothetical protein
MSLKIKARELIRRRGLNAETQRAERRGRGGEGKMPFA